MAVAEGVFVTLDCAEPQALGEFWAAILGGEVKFTSPTTVMVRTEWMWVAALQVEDYVPPTWPSNEVPKQIHLDLGVTDLDAAVAEAERLGATIAPGQPAPDRRRILFDPAGHPFCLTTQVPAEALRPGPAA
jgi:hypothetical protein